MLREDEGAARPWRRSAEGRKAARCWARESADRAVRKLSEELAAVRAQLARAQELLKARRNGDADSVLCRGTLNADAAPFVPFDYESLRAVCDWEVLPPHVCLCSCGATCFSSCSRRMGPPGPLRGQTARPRPAPRAGEAAGRAEAALALAELATGAGGVGRPQRAAQPFVRRRAKLDYIRDVEDQ